MHIYNWNHTDYMLLSFTYAFQRESTLYSCLNVKEPLAQTKDGIWSLTEGNGIRIYNHLVRKRTLNHLTKLASVFIYELSGCEFNLVIIT